MAGNALDNRGRGDSDRSWPSIHPDGRRFGLIALGVALFALIILGWGWLGWPLLLLSLGVFAFFRDPERVVPRGESVLVSPADGIVSRIEEVLPPREMLADDGSGSTGLIPEAVTRVSIHISLFDVHLNRAPIGGTVRRVVYMPGRFLNPETDKAGEDNERQHIVIERDDGVIIGLTQIAGTIARRIVCFVKPGDMIAAGHRVGIIRFGSRVDLYLPRGTGSAVLLGQRVVGGETVIARLGRTEYLEGSRQ